MFSHDLRYPKDLSMASSKNKAKQWNDYLSKIFNPGGKADLWEKPLPTHPYKNYSGKFSWGPVFMDGQSKAFAVQFHGRTQSFPLNTVTVQLCPRKISAIQHL